MLSPDQQRLIRIWDYCNAIEKAVSRFGASWETFSTDMDFQYTVAFSLLQIGELVVRLSQEFRTETAEQVNWTEIKGLRNIVVHDYGRIKPSILWEIVTKDVPELKRFCESVLPPDF